VQDLALDGKSDRFLLRQAKTQGFDTIITRDSDYITNQSLHRDADLSNMTIIYLRFLKVSMHKIKQHTSTHFLQLSGQTHSLYLLITLLLVINTISKLNNTEFNLSLMILV
jgi:hypothetical protein